MTQQEIKINLIILFDKLKSKYRETKDYMYKFININ